MKTLNISFRDTDLDLLVKQLSIILPVNFYEKLKLSREKTYQDIKEEVLQRMNWLLAAIEGADKIKEGN